MTRTVESITPADLSNERLALELHRVAENRVASRPTDVPAILRECAKRLNGGRECKCPRGMRYHAGNCEAFPDREGGGLLK